MTRYAAQRQQFQHKSLAFVRTVMNRNEPRLSSAFAMAKQYKPALTQSPEAGMVIFWGASEPGDCGIYLGNSGLLLHLDAQGRPRVSTWTSVVGTTFIGAMYWPAAPVKRNGANHGTV